MVDLLSSRILHPWLCITSFRKLHTDMAHLLDGTAKFIHHMKTSFTNSCHIKTTTIPARTSKCKSQVSNIKAINKPEYMNVS